jgi:hypothetical protein
MAKNLEMSWYRRDAHQRHRNIWRHGGGGVMAGGWLFS